MRVSRDTHLFLWALGSRKDPFDRMLLAQAWVERMILLTDDDTLGGYGDFVEVV